MKDFIKQRLNEMLVLKNWDEFVILVAKAYTEAPEYDASVVHCWNALNASNHTLFQRLLSKVYVIFTSTDKSKLGKINIMGRTFQIVPQTPEKEYSTAAEMKSSYEKTGILYISIDYSDHRVFSLEDNIIFRTVHDFIVHILGNHDFGAKGEIASYNRHAKLAPKDAIPALFTEVVGQASIAVTTGNFPKQKIALLKGFDYYKLGVIDDANYEIKNKVLVRKSEETSSI